MNKMTYLQTIKSMRDSLPDDKMRNDFDLQLAGREKNPVIALILSLCFGCFGVDRFYCGRIGLGVLKLVTLGGMGVWTLIDWFMIMGIARKRNLDIAKEIKFVLAPAAVSIPA